MSWIVDSGFQVLSMELGFLIPIVNRIPDSLSCVPDSKAQDSRLHKQNFPGFQNLDSLMWGGDEGRVVRTSRRKCYRSLLGFGRK